MKPSFTTAEQFMTKLRTIFFGIAVAPIAFFLFAYLQYDSGQMKPMPSEDGLLSSLQMIVPLFAIAAFAGSFMLYRNKLSAALSEPSLGQKLAALLSAVLIKNALLESAGLFAATAFYLTGHPIFTIVFVLYLIIFAAGTPTTHFVIEALKLDGKDAEIIRQGLPLEEK